MWVLEVENIHTFYGFSRILQGVSIQVAKGEVVCLLGRNGMGKTTLIRSIMALTPPKLGKVKFNGAEIQNLPVHLIANLGIGYVPQGRGVFPDLTVHEHLEAFCGRMGKDRKRKNQERAYQFFPKLKQLEDRKGGFLSGGEQQMLAIARALVRNPQLMLLDEPSEGLAPVVLEMIQKLISELKADGETMLLAEQNVRFALEISDRGYILEKGRICLQKPASEMKDDEEVHRFLTAQ
jgi:branched-chain amino acid transport system ATP-binding protein